MTPEVSISIKNCTRRFGPLTAVNALNLTVAKGEIFGLVGPDGAGKTTLFRILTTLLLPDSGSATVCGYDTVKQYREIRNIVGYMPGRFSLYQDLTVEENINFFATIFKTTIKENYGIVKDIYSQIEPFKDRRAGKLSGGMKQKLALSCALIHKPSVLLLDEPTAGVDTPGEKTFYDLIDDVQRQHKLSVILVSHDLSMVYSHASRVYALNGVICCEVPPEQVMNAESLKEAYGIHATPYLHHHVH
jgi:ABC-type multidrug transport system ATPase subunit